jgi:hypothetical protein
MQTPCVPCIKPPAHFQLLLSLQIKFIKPRGRVLHFVRVWFILPRLAHVKSQTGTTTPCRLSRTPNSVCSQIPSISGSHFLRFQINMRHAVVTEDPLSMEANFRQRFKLPSRFASCSFSEYSHALVIFSYFPLSCGVSVCQPCTAPSLLHEINPLYSRAEEVAHPTRLWGEVLVRIPLAVTRRPRPTESTSFIYC